ncbi:MAG: cation:proton antiporter [Patescibacteria group bacterium]
MSNEHISIVLLSLTLLLFTAIIAGRFAQRFGIPKVIGEVLGGIIVGQTVFGLFFPELYQSLFTPKSDLSEARDFFIKIGAIFFLFIIGLEINLPKAKTLRKTILWTSLSGLAFPFILGFASVFFFPHLWHYSSENLALPLFIGTALSISALPVIARILIDFKLLKSKIGSIIIASATIDDIVGWIFFALIVNHFSPTETHSNPVITIISVLLVFLFALTLGKKLVNKLLLWSTDRKDGDTLFLGLTIILVFLTAILAEKIGIHHVLGAYLIGLAFAKSKLHKMHNALRQMVLSFFAPLYFVSVGLTINFFQHFDPLLTLLIIGIATIGKVGGVFFGTHMAKLTVKESLVISFGLNARGAVEIILATAAYQVQIIDEKIFVGIIIMAIVTTVISGPVIRSALARL